MTQRRQQWFVEIWKGTTYRRANHFTGSLLWKVSDWHFKVEVDSIESKSFQQSPKLLPRSRPPRHYKYFHFNFHEQLGLQKYTPQITISNNMNATRMCQKLLQDEDVLSEFLDWRKCFVSLWVDLRECPWRANG